MLYTIHKYVIFFAPKKSTKICGTIFGQPRDSSNYTLNLQVSVLEMDGQFDRLDELIYVESHLSNISTKFYGEVTQQMLKHADFPGSNNGTGLFQTIVGLKIRDLYEQIVASRAAAPLEATKA